jgi:hypothetical protein
VHRVSIVEVLLSIYSNVIKLLMMWILMYLFQENKSYGVVKPICIHPLMFITVCHKSRRAQEPRVILCQLVLY